MEYIIPKKIHYCWYGGQFLPKLAKRCLDSWSRHLPDYELKRWDESNTDLTANRYVREAYEAGKYAFVSDYMRLKVLYEEGGIYMDTDVEVVKNLDCFLVHRAFSGFESPLRVPTGIMGAEKGHSWIQYLLKLYDKKGFIKEDGKYDTTPNTVLITKASLKQGLKLTNEQQMFNGVVIYPKKVFCPKDYDDYRYETSECTYTVHHFSGSWYSRETRWLMNFKIHIVKRFFPMLDKPLTTLYHRFWT